MIDETDPEFWPTLWANVGEATLETLYQVSVTMLLTALIGLAVGVLLVVTDRGGMLEAPFGSRAFGRGLNWVLQVVVNLGRSIPFIILMIALIPFTRWIVGTAFSVTAAIVPLAIAAIPFFARIVEIALREVPAGLMEAGSSIGATKWQLVSKVLIPEAGPALVLGLTTTAVSVVNFSAIVGVIGGGGLGDLAIRYGHQRYSTPYIIVVVVVLVVIVTLIQAAGNRMAMRMRGGGPARTR